MIAFLQQMKKACQLDGVRFVAVVTTVIWWCAGASSWARVATSKDSYKANAPKYVVVPIMYLTDRELLGETYGPRRRYPFHCQHHMYYGTAFVSVANSHHLSEKEIASASLNWKGSDDKPAKICDKDRIDPTNPEVCKQTFMSRITEALKQSGQNQLCVYVHGAEDAFEDSIQDAANLEYSLERPLIMYSWPSDPKMRGYFIDGSNNEWSQGHFDMFCKDLIALHDHNPFDLVLISHSMGNRLVIRSLPVIVGTNLVKKCELVSPDMDADTCRHYSMGYSEGSAKIRLYVSNRDKMLPLSQMLAGGYYRLGEAANPFTIPTEWKDLANRNLIERIDFTAVDKGFSGHSIPFDLIANIVRNDEPGPGLKLVPESAVRGNRLVRFADKSDRLSPQTSGLPSELCKRVVKISATEGSKSDK